MANMNTIVTSNPMGRWWHPLPLIAPVVMLLSSIIMKCIGLSNDMSWWQVIAFPLICDVASNAIVLIIWSITGWISKMKHRDKEEIQP